MKIRAWPPARRFGKPSVGVAALLIAALALSACVMLPAIIRLLRSYAPPGMDARAISYASSFQCIGNGLVPFCAGLIGPVLGLRVYFGLCTVLTLGGLMLWLRRAGNHA